MIKLLFTLFVATFALFGGITPAGAQEPVTTGTIQGMIPKAGTLTVRSDQTSRAMTFQGMDRANIFTTDGKMAQMSDLQVGMTVTVQYAVRGDQWFVSKVILGGTAPAGGGAGSPQSNPGSVGKGEAMMKPLVTGGNAPLRRRLQP